MEKITNRAFYREVESRMVMEGMQYIPAIKGYKFSWAVTKKPALPKGWFVKLNGK